MFRVQLSMTIFSRRPSPDFRACEGGAPSSDGWRLANRRYSSVTEGAKRSQFSFTIQWKNFSKCTTFGTNFSRKKRALLAWRVGISESSIHLAACVVEMCILKFYVLFPAEPATRRVASEEPGISSWPVLGGQTAGRHGMPLKDEESSMSLIN